MSSSSVNSGVVGERGIPTKCYCGLAVTVFTFKTQENPGRTFFRCISKRDALSWSTKRDGHLFKWIDDALLEEVEDNSRKLAITGNEINKVKAEAMELKSVIEELKEELNQSKLEMRKWKMYSKLYFFWVFLLTIVLAYCLVGKEIDKEIIVSH